ncbi:hypothetical protein OSB04_022301 [Centaurea solstitialis]|uniref:Fatty acid desaturase domain-containing protein n=1 Tax=Centaurea solstitialis TaxID=347529 RepID=A0AA38TFP9_9ASTR|nr:hypothetical protein OSB04_022301 [Centaurea solstitialis]
MINGTEGVAICKEVETMGAGGRMNVAAGSEKPHAFKRVPVSKPPFELSDLKKAVPPHCFKRSLVRSFAALFRDIIIVTALYYLAATIIPVLPKPLRTWHGHFIGSSKEPILWVCGSLATNAAIMASASTNGLMTLHRTHHANTNSIEYDEVWIPKRKSDKLYSEILNNPLGSFVVFVFKIVLGFPLYFVFNLYGRKYEKGITSHFYPYSPIFNDSERFQIFLTDLGVFGTLYGVYRLALIKGTEWVINFYGMPILFMSGFFILLTYLHHTHPSIPHYDSTEWDWLRGAMATVDRNFGFLNHAFHDVTRTHAVHHLFPTIPHYHTFEARLAVMPILGDYYKYDDTPILEAVWRETKDCIFIEPDEVNGEKKGIYWFYK